MPKQQEAVAMDWSDCPKIEVIPRKVSGVLILKHSRMPADAVFETYEGGSSVDEIAENFDLPEDQIRAVLAYAVKRNSPRSQ